MKCLCHACDGKDDHCPHTDLREWLAVLIEKEKERAYDDSDRV